MHSPDPINIRSQVIDPGPSCFILLYQTLAKSHYLSRSEKGSKAVIKINDIMVKKKWSKLKTNAFYFFGKPFEGFENPTGFLKSCVGSPP